MKLKRTYHPEEIKGQMRSKGVSISALSEELGVTPGAVSLVIHNRSKSERIREKIAQILGIPVADLWIQNPPKENPLYRRKKESDDTTTQNK